MNAAISAPRHALIVIALIVLTLIGSLPGLSSMQAIDRDEARYAQASVQMRDSGDYVNIRFHDRERHKKPAGIYWLQTLSLKAFSTPQSRDIWVHRLPSVLAGLIAVLGLYWSGLALYGPRGAFLSALLLSVSLLFIFESHIAKTDAALCAASVWVLGGILRLRQLNTRALSDANLKRQKRYAVIVWIALGCGVIIKGPILPAIVIISILTIIIWEKVSGTRKNGWRPLLSPLGICLFALIVLPWYIMIFQVTDGEFFKTAIGQDLGPKLAGGHESHGAPPGVYILSVFATLWPASLFLPAGALYAIKAARGTLPKSSAITQAQARWLLAWIIPFWIVLEFIPTKLTHYALPLFPVLCLFMAGAALSLYEGHFKKTHRLGAIIFLSVTAILLVIIIGAQTNYGTLQNDQNGKISIWAYALGISAMTGALLTTIFIFKDKIRSALIGLIVTGLGLSIATYGFIIPHLSQLRLAPRIMDAFHAHDIILPRNGGPLVRSPHYTEPSLVYYLGKNMLLGKHALDFTQHPLRHDHIWILDMRQPDTPIIRANLERLATQNNKCLQEYSDVRGLNYSKGLSDEIGDSVQLAIVSIGC